MTLPEKISADYTLRPSELAEVLALLVAARQPCLVRGPSGCAKSQIAQQVATGSRSRAGEGAKHGGAAGVRAGPAGRVEAMNMTTTFTDQDGSPTLGRAVHRTTWRAHAFVLGGLALATVYTAAMLGLDAGAEHLGPLWMVAIAWTVVASLAGALWRGFCHRDWSAFSGYELPEHHGAFDEWASHTDDHSWIPYIEDLPLHDDDHPR